ncbi:MAG: hypothetical protein EKK37_00015 [Sphingobacteriales bacterium]|nr:MAG: hypothetical protein EKK37_00015 [Sphingobacteriales bacterium]
MVKNLLHLVYGCIILAACNASSRNVVRSFNRNTITDTFTVTAAIDSSSHDFDTMTIAGKTAASLLDLPVTQDGAIILSPGFYEADFKSYCLQPGTPDPSSRDAYGQQVLNTYHRDIVETALRQSLIKTDLDQRNIQLLLWSIVSGSSFDRLSPEVQQTAGQLLTRKQIFELRGGVTGMIKRMTNYIPNNSGDMAAIKGLFEKGANSYEAFEKIAVRHEPSIITDPNYRRDQWNWQPGGYFLRYYPASYKQLKVQVYVPANVTSAAAIAAGKYLLFDPVLLMAAPANSNAQHLGIGAPVIGILRKVIQVNTNGPKLPKPKTTAKSPKAIS